MPRVGTSPCDAEKLPVAFGRDRVDALRNMRFLTPGGQQVALGTVAAISASEGPPLLRSENGRPVTWIYVDARGRNLTSIVADLRRAIALDVKLPPGISVSFTGQFGDKVRFNFRWDGKTAEIESIDKI